MKSFGEPPVGEGEGGFALAAKKVDGGAREKFEGDQRRDRVARQTEEWTSAAFPENDWCAGLDLDAVEVKGCAQRRESIFHEVEFAGRDASGEQEQVGGEALLDMGARIVAVILRNAQDLGNRARADHLRCQGVRV